MSRYGGWGRYVPVAERQAKALRKVKKLQKQGLVVQPVIIEKRNISKTFWGNAWCKHIELFSDYENRLPRGRSYVRNGSVCHLAIEKGEISAIVAGSSVYNVDIKISALSDEKWKTIKLKCSGQIGSLLELLDGKLSDSVMNTVCHKQNGLFPTPSEIQLSCSCPDGANMCKHVAAVLYGVAARLDHSPHQLFLLRGVEHKELVDVSSAIISATQKSKTTRKRIDDSALAGIFGIEMDAPALEKKGKKLPDCLTGLSIRKKRQSMGLTQTAFAKKIGVSAVTISQWECKGKKNLNPKKVTEKKLKNIW